MSLKALSALTSVYDILLKINKNSLDPINEVATLLDNAINQKFNIQVQNFGNKDFDLLSNAWKGPLWYLDKNVVNELTDFINGFTFECLVLGIYSLSRDLIEAHKKGKGTLSSTVGHQIIIQLVSSLYSGLLFIKIKKNIKSPAEDLADTYKSSIGSNPSVGNTLLWISRQQLVMISKSFIQNPAGLSFWFSYYLPLFENSSASEHVQNSALDYVTAVVKGFELSSKNVKFTPPVLPLNTFIKLLNIAYSDVGKSRGGRGDLVSNKLKVVAKNVKDLIFSRLVATDIGANDFILLLTNMSQNSDTNLADIAIEMLRYESIHNKSPAGLPPILNMWKGLVGTHLEGTKLILDCLQQESKKNTLRWKQVSSGAFKRFLSIIQASFYRKENVSKPKIAALKKVTKTLQSRLPSCFKTWKAMLSNLFWRVLFAYFVFYCVTEVACKPCTGDMCPSTPVGCPLNHPLAKSATNHFKKDILPHLTHTYSQLNSMYLDSVAPLLETHVTPAWILYGAPVWDAYVEPSISQIPTNPIISDIMSEKIPMMIERIKGVWHNMSVYFVQILIPRAINNFEMLVSFLRTKVYPHLAKYYSCAYNFVRSGLDHLKGTQQYVAFRDSAFGRGLGEIYGVWEDGARFLVDGARCGLGFERSRVLCDEAGKVGDSFLKYFGVGRSV